MKGNFLVLALVIALCDQAGYCSDGNQINRDAPPPGKSYVAAMAISFFAPGGGTIYAGKPTRGGIELGCTFLSLGLGVAAGSGNEESWAGIVAATLFVSTWIVSMVDAPIAVWQYNNKRSRTVMHTPDKAPAVISANHNNHIRLLSLRF